MSGDNRRVPQNVDAERAILSAAFLDAVHVIPTVSNMLTPDDFFLDHHRRIWRVMCEVADRPDTPVDLVSVATELRAHGWLDFVGGEDYLVELNRFAPSAANVAYYAAQVRETANQRRMMHMASDVLELARDGETTADIVDAVQRQLDTIQQSSGMTGRCRSLGDVAESSVAKLQARYRANGEISGVTTGFTALDRITCGWQPGTLSIIAARPSMGKTALMLSSAILSARHGTRILLVSIEMTANQIYQRALSQVASVDSSKFRSGNLSPSDFPRLDSAAAEIASMPITIDDSDSMTLPRLRSMIAAEHARDGLDLVMVDYLQLIRIPDRWESSEKEIGAVAAGLKAIAKRLDLPVVALAQLNRNAEARRDKRPAVGDLRGSGEIEQHADIIALLYRPEVADPDSDDKGIAEVIIAKHRDGPSDTIRLRYTAAYTRFSHYFGERDPREPEQLWCDAD